MTTPDDGLLDSGALDSAANDGAALDDGIPEAPPRSIRKIVFRIVFIIAAIGISTWILAQTFDDLDPAEIMDGACLLDDAEIISLASMWVIWVAAQGLLTASLVPGLAVRHGIVAFLGPASVTSIVPGPSDLPIRSPDAHVLGSHHRRGHVGRRRRRHLQHRDQAGVADHRRRSDSWCPTPRSATPCRQWSRSA